MSFPDFLVSARLRRDVEPEDEKISVLHRIRIDDEVIHVVRHMQPGPGETKCWVIRGAEGTVAVAHSKGATVEAAP